MCRAFVFRLRRKRVTAIVWSRSFRASAAVLRPSSLTLKSLVFQDSGNRLSTARETRDGWSSLNRHGLYFFRRRCFRNRGRCPKPSSLSLNGFLRQPRPPESPVSGGSATISQRRHCSPPGLCVISLGIAVEGSLVLRNHSKIASKGGARTHIYRCVRR
jgi:hypothetical protein